MKALQDKNVVFWLLVFLGIFLGFAIYRIGFHRPVPASDEEAVQSLKNQKLQEVQTQPKEESPSAPKEEPSVGPQESAPQTPQTADLKSQQVNERQYSSENPLYFRAVFGEASDHSTLGVLDESGGTATGYDVVYVDENRNGDLTDDAAKKLAKYDRGSYAGQINPTFKFCGPLGERSAATYYTLTRRDHAGPGEQYFFWTLDADGWNYFFINGKMTLFSSAADALKSKPVRLGGQCAWEINSRSQNRKPLISAGLKDENGCTLRIVRQSGKAISPTLTLTQDGQVKAEEKMKFG
ncbi:MAG: hypothetical protein P8Z79_14465 [Sedimentisphaerales bacterium]